MGLASEQISQADGSNDLSTTKRIQSQQTRLLSLKLERINAVPVDPLIRQNCIRRKSR